MSVSGPLSAASSPGTVRTSGETAMPPAVVTIAATHGAGGSIVGPKVAERLGVMFMDRVISTAVAERTGVPEDVVTTYEQQPRSGISRIISGLSQMAPPDGPPAVDVDRDESRLRIEVEEFLGEASVNGGVILGRGANFVLRNVVPGVLCVLLTGPREARILQAMQIDNVDRATAEQRLNAYDEARRGYVRRNYGAQREEPTDYHLIIDSTVMDYDAVTELIVSASTARRRHHLQSANGKSKAS
jgi:cytidylate kinase